MPSRAGNAGGPGDIPATERPASALPTWIPLAAMASLMLVTLRQVVRPLTDPDLWWHLRLGDEFRGSWSLGNPGQLSPFATSEWVPTQWLPEVLASLVEDVFGLRGIVWLTGAALLALLVCVFRLCRRESAGLAAVVATAAAVVGMSASLSPRPHLVSYILLAITLGAWLDTARDLKPRWWLVPLSWVWACSHGMWFVGVVVGIVVIVGMALDRSLKRGPAFRLVGLSALCTLAAALTPVGPRLLLAPFAVGNVSSFVTEWAAPSFKDTAPLVTMVMIGLVILSWGRRGQTSWVLLGLLALALGWTLLSQRTVTLGAVIAAPLLASVIQAQLRQPFMPRSSRAETGKLLASAAVCLVGLAVVAPAASVGGVPGALNADLEALPQDAVVFNDYTLGGWLSWRHPDVHHVVDGLTEAYSTEHLRGYGVALSVRDGWAEFVVESGATHALLEVDSPLATALQERRGWRAEGTDAGYVLLVSNQR